MSMTLFHPSIEGAQHGPKGFEGFLDFAAENGAAGAQPSNFMLENPDGDFLSASRISQMFDNRGLKIDGISAHCPFWVHTSAWTGTKTIRPFLSADVARQSVEEITQWTESYIFRLLDLCAELGVRIVPMFWGAAYGLEAAGGYPWGLWQGGEGDLAYDLLQEGDERFVTMTQKVRGHAKQLGIVLAHEIHPGTAASCAADFMRLIVICDDFNPDFTLGVNADPSHCWEGEDWRTRFTVLGMPGANRIVGCHVKNHRVQPGLPLRCMEPDWRARAMSFTPLHQGDIDLVQYVECMILSGYHDAYTSRMLGATAPLVCEAEAAFQDLDLTAIKGIEYIANTLCFPVATESFEDGMGAGDE